MASITSPRLNNTIRADVPAINAILKALAKADPSILSDIENGTKRFYEGTSGWEFQELKNGAWTTHTKFNIDAQSVDGFNTSVDAVASTIVVRGTDGKLKGNLTGKADTAGTADKLASTLAVNAGGTGATKAEDARANLGVPPTNHKSTLTTYGVSSATEYGHSMAGSDTPKADSGTGAVGSDVSHFARQDHVHPQLSATSSVKGDVKLSDATNSTSAASASIAATPKAVKAAYDLANTAKTTADSAATAAADASKYIKVDLDNYTAEIRRAGNADNYSLSTVITNKTDGTNQFKTIVSKDGVFLPTVVQKVNGSVPNSSGEITIPTGTSALGFTPVQQGGGTRQGGNKVYIGWATDASGVRCQIDSTDMGYILCTNKFPGQTMLYSEGIPGTGTVTRSISVKKDCPLCLCVVMDTGDSSSFSIKVTATAGFPINNTLMVCPKNSGIMGMVWPNATTVSLTLEGASSSNQCSIYLYAWQWS